MRLSNVLLNSIPLDAAAQATVDTSLLQLPHLISERCLTGAAGQLAAETKARFSSGCTPLVETIAMPKRGLGPRPIGVLSPETRTLYEALVRKLTPSLPEPSRAKGIESHHGFGVDEEADDDQLIVDFDIAACYEYVDHRILAEELVLQTVDADTVVGLQTLLGEIFRRQLGIPQALAPSHLLADVYLNKLERDISRAGFSVSRFADDFRIVVHSWGDAHTAIERAVDIARNNGLVLAEGKTSIKSVGKIREEEASRDASFQEYRSLAADELKAMDLVQVDYDEFEEIEIEADPADIDFAAYQRVVKEWASGSNENRSMYTHFGTRALKVLQSSPERVNDEWLVSISRKEPIRLYSVMNYLVKREEVTPNWSVLTSLTNLPRQSPWARLWMLRLADLLAAPDAETSVDVLLWAESLLDDRYEVVRAEAAWLLAKYDRLAAARVADLYVNASDISRIGLAACAGRLDRASSSGLGKAIRGDSVLTKAAYSWGRSE